MRSSSSNLYSFSGLTSSSSYKNPVTSPPSTSSFSPYSSSASVSSSRFSSTSINPGSPSPLVPSSFFLDPPRKISSIPDYGCSPAPSASSYESRLSSRRSSSSDVRSVVQQQPNARQTRTTETDSLLELYGVRGRGTAAGGEPAKRKSSGILEERKKGLPTLEEGVSFRRGSREGIFDLPGSSRDPRDLLLGGRITSEGGRFAEKIAGGGPGGGGGFCGLMPSTSMVGGGPGGLAGEINQIEYTNRLLEAHKRVDDLLRKRGLSAEDERKYLRAWEEIPVVREVRNYDNYDRRRSHSSDSGLSTDSDETKERPLPEVSIEADEDWEMDEFDEAHADAVLPESPTEKVAMRTREFGKTKTEAATTIAKKPQAEIARRILIQPKKTKMAVSATFAASVPPKIAVVDVEKTMKKRIHKEGVLKSLTLPKRTSASVAATIKVAPPVVVKKDEKSCTFRAPSRSVSRGRGDEKKPGLLDKVLLRRTRPATTANAAPAAPEAPTRPILRKVRPGSLDVVPEAKKPSPPGHLHPLDACKTILASLKPKKDRVARSSAEISVQHCSFFQTAQTIIAKARALPEKNVRINLRLTERAPYRDKTKIVLACARAAVARLDISLHKPTRRRTIQFTDPEARAPARRVGKLERAMTIEAPYVRPERVVRPLQIPQSFLEKTPSQDDPETKEDFKAAREKLKKVPFVDCLTGLDLPIYWLDSPNASAPKVVKRKDSGSEPKNKLLERLIGKEQEKEKDGKPEESQKLKRQNAFKKKRRGVDGDSVSLSSLGGKSGSPPPLNSDSCSARRATAAATPGQPAAVPRIAHVQSSPHIPDIALFSSPSEDVIYDDVDKALVRSFRASLSIPKPVALRRPVTPLPLDSSVGNQAQHRLRDYKSPPPPTAFLQRRTPPRNSEYEEEEEQEEVEETRQEEEVEQEAEQVSRATYEFANGANLTEAEQAMIAAKKRHEDEEAAKVEEYMEKRRLEKENEEEELRKLKERQEQRKREREEEELAFAARMAEEEEKRKILEDERRAKHEAEKAKKEEERAKRQQQMAGLTGGRNFVIPEKKDKGDKFGNIVQAKQEMGMTKDQQLEAKRIFMAAVMKGMDASGLLPADLKGKIKELHQRICKLETEKYDLEKRHERQEYDLKELNERQRQMARNNALKKGLDPADSNSRHP
ncbi:hypothetical protein PMAYCL1PPCAC_32602, partial [Pristionchus mayeri]